MRKSYFVSFSTIFTILFSTLVFSQISVFEDKFDTYIVGQQLACQNSIDWTTWNLTPCNVREDPLVSNIHSLSGSSSVAITDSNDLVRRHGSFISGMCDISFQIYIPMGKAGYFNTLAGFAPNTNNWAMQCWFDLNGVARLDAGGASAATFSYNRDSWQMVRLVVDLEMDSAKFWFNGTLIRTWQWTRGWDGTIGSSPLRLDATDFFGATANDEMYVDDFLVKYYPKIGSTTSGGNWSSPDTWIGGIVPLSGNPVEIVNTAIINLDNNISRDAGTIINGRLNCGTHIISGIGNFILSPGGTLGIASPGGISLTGTSGNIQVTGARSYNAAANYIYNGSLAQSSGNGLSTVNNLTINNSAGLNLSTNVFVSGVLTLSNGIINSSSLNMLTINASGGISGGSSSSFINGPLARTKNTAGQHNLLFPIGKNGSYRPIELLINHGNATSSVYTAEVFNSAPINRTLPSSLNLVSSVRYWNISKTGSANVTSAFVTLFYGIDDGVTDALNLRIAKQNDATWQNLGGTGNGSSIQSTTSFTTFSDFVLANAVGGSNPLPVELSSFNAVCKGKEVVLYWTTQTEVNNYGFEIERTSIEKLKNDEWEILGFLIGNGNSNSIKEYSFVDNKVNPGKYFYRLNQIDNDGEYNYSHKIEVLLIEIPEEFILEQNYPNPFNPVTTIKFLIPKSSFVNLSIYDVLGNKIESPVNEELIAGEYNIELDGKNLSSGIYYYSLETVDFRSVKKMILLK